MNPLIRKETRLLLPAWMAALVAATMPLWPWVKSHDGLWPGCFAAAMLALALSPFGQEMSHGTFGLLLVQPEDRRRFWRIKTGLLAVAMVSAWMLLTLCLWSLLSTRFLFVRWFEGSALLMLAAFSGGLWSTLLLREMVPALLCTLIVPIMIGTATMMTVSHWTKDGIDPSPTILFCVWAAYGVAGFWWARRLFLRAQDVAWTGGQITLTVRGVPLRWLAFEFEGGQNRWTALVKKELQLQEITMVLIPFLALLYLAGLALLHLAPHRIPKEVVLGGIPAMWLAVVPLVIGCVAVAEERRLNTLEGLLCLPISRRSQFAVKLGVALALGIVLGGIIPWFLLGLGGMRPNDFHVQNAMEVAALITGIAFYASTMSRGFLQTIPTILCFVALMETAVYLLWECFPGDADNIIFASGAIFPLLAWPVMTVTIAWLAFKNYQQLQIGWRVWVGNLTRAGAVTVCVTLASVAIFDRSWELFQTLEPPHGPARITGAGRAGMGFSGQKLYALLPDCRICIGELSWTKEKGNISLSIVSGGFAPGSNWVQSAANYNGEFALRSDGSLWSIRSASDVRQVGFDSDWKAILGGEGLFLAVKRNGTLWGWGHDHSRILGECADPRGTNISDPVRIGGDSDWVNVFMLGDQQAMGIKRDDGTWKWGYVEVGKGKWAAASVRQKVRGRFQGTNWQAMTGVGEFTLGIRTDGSLWVAGNYILAKIFGEDVSPSLHQGDVIRVGAKSDWIVLNRDRRQITALESDGTLWMMDFRRPGNYKRPSKYTDWLAAAGNASFTWSLARDGTLTCWNAFYMHEPDEKDPFIKRILLGPSRRPVFSGNILAEPQ
ncbi:MAG: hypothetical protein ABSA83_12250 [Verrucomicrobiota bacterium]|jgi:hypothetical protein